MRVLHVITGLAAGGAETQLRLLLQHSRHDSAVVVLYNAGSVAAQLRTNDIPVLDLGMKSNKEVGAVLRLAQIMRRGRYDVVHTHLYRACLYGRVAARLAGVRRIIATEHSLLDDSLEGHRATCPVRLLYRMSERFGHVTIAVSRAVRDNLLAWGLRPDRVVVVPDGLDLQALEFDPQDRRRTRSALGIPQSAEVIGAVGRLHPGKLFDELLRELAPTLHDGRHVVLLGEGRERRALERLSSKLHVTDCVHLVGEQPVVPFLAAMDVLASPSRQETFGLAILEALANGLPVVYRRCPALEELGGHVATAVRLGPRDDLRAALERVLSRRREDRTCPQELQPLDIRTVAASIEDLYARPSRRAP
jgi:glycosyltransferase involved in cell wall biosynthesis